MTRSEQLRYIIAGGIVTLAVTYGAAWLSTNPSWQSLEPDMALVRISFSHGGDRSASCRDLTEEERATLPRNMQRKQICDRSYPPVTVELDIDGETVLARELPPSGFSGTGPSRIYERIVVPAGAHDFTARLRDKPSTEGFDYEGQAQAVLAPGQSYVIEFKPEQGGFVFQ